MSKKRFTGLILALLLVVIFLSALYLAIGDQNVPLNQLFSNAIVLRLRLPRLISLYLVGFLLSTSGFLVQLMTRNPIAEMSTLGISGGASAALALLLVLGLPSNDTASSLVAVLGAFVALICVMLFAARSRFQPLKVVLVGTSVGLFTTSLASSLTFAANQTQSYFLWIVGSFSGMTLQKVQILALVSALFLILLLIFANRIKILGLGEEMATTLGISVQRIRFLIVVMVALASGFTVASVGVISFVGLIAPQIAKRLTRHYFWQNVILSSLIGMLLLVLADFLARNLLRPYEFPAGSLTMLLGAPFFLWTISQSQKEGQ